MALFRLEWRALKNGRLPERSPAPLLSLVKHYPASSALVARCLKIQRLQRGTIYSSRAALDRNKAGRKTTRSSSRGSRSHGSLRSPFPQKRQDSKRALNPLENTWVRVVGDQILDARPPIPNSIRPSCCGKQARLLSSKETILNPERGTYLVDDRFLLDSSFHATFAPFFVDADLSPALPPTRSVCLSNSLSPASSFPSLSPFQFRRDPASHR